MLTLPRRTMDDSIPEKDLPYKKRMQQALEWLQQHPEEKVVAAARVWHLRENSLRVALTRLRKNSPPRHRATEPGQVRGQKSM